MTGTGPDLLGYSIDTNVVIDGRVRRYPPDVFGRLWSSLTGLIQAGRAVIAEEVLYELGRGDDDCHTWAKDENGLVVPATADVVNCVAAIAAAYPEWVSGSKNEADPWVIAHAKVREWIVVTDERWSRAAEVRNTKIPNVCAQFGVPCINFLEMARQEGWSF